jgi:hypothetical protein
VRAQGNAPVGAPRAYNVLVASLHDPRIEEHRDAYLRARLRIRAMLTTTEPYVRPSQSRDLHPFVQLDFPEIRRDKFEPGVILDKTAFATAACARPPPLTTADIAASAALPEDLKLAIDVVSERGGLIANDRLQRLAELEQIADSLAPLRSLLDSHKSDCAKLIAASFNVAFTAAVIDAMEWPDSELPLRYVKGFASIFDIADSGVFRPEHQPAEIDEQTFKAANTRMVAKLSDEIERAATQGDDETRSRRAHCWTRTKEEIQKKLVFGPYSRARMDKKYGRGKWRCIGRNAIWQKNKWRCIDNGKRSKHNKATTMRERITCGRADFPVMIAREFARREVKRSTIAKKRKLRMHHGTNDLMAAYRRVPTSTPEYTCVAVWNADAGKVSYLDVPGHNFGLKSAVVNFNRFPEMATCAARRLLWVVSEHYYDDNDITEPDWAEGSGQAALVYFCSERLLGFPFDPEQEDEMDTSNEYLGVISDLVPSTEGTVEMDVSRKRRSKLKALVVETEQDNTCRSGLASSIFGKAGFMLSPCYGSVGSACLQPVKRREYQKNAKDLDDDLRDSLEFIKLVCDKLPPVRLPLLPTSGDRVVIFTDAEGKKRRGGRAPSGHLGFTVFHPDHGRRYAHAQVPPSIIRLLDAIKQRDTYIGQFELIAAITPFISLPADWLEGRQVELWIDNSGAIGGLLRGYSGIPDCARIVNIFKFATAKLCLASLYIDYVPSESNPADIPSRLHEMDDDEAAGAVADLGDFMEMTIPDFADDEGRWLSFADIAASVWGE